MSAKGLIGIGALLLAAAPAAAAPSSSLAAHRAIYDLVLDQSNEDNQAAPDISGRMVMEFTGSACAGYTTKVRFVTESADSDGQSQIVDSRSDLFEAGDGESLTFSNETYTDNAITEESKGSAKRESSEVAVALSKPEAKKFAIRNKVVFPTEQMEALINAAKSGQNFVNLDLYDGSEDGQTVFTTAGIIGHEAAADPAGDSEGGIIKSAGISGLRHWPVTISYFKDGPDDSEPYYTMSFVV